MTSLPCASGGRNGIGGADTEISATTKNVLLEAANWNFINIRRTMHQQKVFTDAGVRFSRGVHPSQAVLGVQRGIELMRQSGGGAVANRTRHFPHDAFAPQGWSMSTSASAAASATAVGPGRVTPRFSGGQVIGMADLLQDLFAEGIWHVGTFIAATSLHGTGRPHEMYGAMETWMAAAGARWLRLGVVEANARGAAFWRRVGYSPVRVREGFEIGGRKHRLHVLAKPLGEADWEAYLRSVPRDRP